VIKKPEDFKQVLKRDTENISSFVDRNSYAMCLKIYRIQNLSSLSVVKTEV